MTVIANHLEVAGEATGHTVIYMNPSVCITPAAPSPLPMPYPIMTPDGTSSLKDGTRRVTMGGKPVFNVDSAVSSCTGNEPGTQKEVVSLKTGSSAFIINGSTNVIAEGKAVVFTTSSGMGNQM
jgi:uncharacterized Zn-binding protein involved in type VI secretion